MALTWLRNAIRELLVPFGGTISVPFDGDKFPIAIQNEILGGAHSYETLDSLAADLPKMRMQLGMLVTVLRHVRDDDGTIFERTTMVLDPSEEIWTPFIEDNTLEQISDIEGYDLSLFWKPFDMKAAQASSNKIESQYADAQDLGRLGDPSAPAFQLPLISPENYQAGKRSNSDGTIIWDEEYDPTVHKYERQRLGETGQWGIPKLINAQSYSEGDYVDNRFIWVAKSAVPTRPPSILNGKSNGDPAGWQNTPEAPEGNDYYDYIEDHDLFKITATKDTYGILKSEWSTPLKVSTNPRLVRYGNNRSSTDFIAEGGGDTADWRGYYTPGLDTYMATRIDEDSAWRIQTIDNEDGEYVDFIFKAFALGYEPIDADRPTINNPFSELDTDYPNNKWKDFPFVVENNEVLHRSTGRKYNSGELKPSGWSVPTRADGKDIMQVVIEPQTAQTFKYGVAGDVSPESIVLKARLYRGNELVEADVNFAWYKGSVDSANKLIKGSSAGVSQYHSISGTQDDTLAISNLAVENQQLYSLVAILGGEDYIDVVTILDVSDGAGIIAVIDTNGGFSYKNSGGTITFTSKLYFNGFEVNPAEYLVRWFLGADEISDDTSVDVSADDFTDKETLKLEITYQGGTYTRSETLVDISDAPATLAQYSTQDPLPVNPADRVWTTSEDGAVYMRLSFDGGVTYDNPIRVRGENAPYNGGFQKSVFRNNTGQPVATGVGSNLLPTNGGWTAQPTSPGPGQQTWQATAFFVKNPATSDTAMTSANWTIDGSWSTAIRITGTDGDVEGPQGDAGPVGWSPVIAVVTRNATSEVLQVVNWTNLGGADPSTKPAVNYYLSATGFTTDINAAKNVKGSAVVASTERPMYWVSAGTKALSPPSSTLSSQGTLQYASLTLQVQNTWTSPRPFKIIGEVPVSNDNGSDSWAVRLLTLPTSSWPSSASAPFYSDFNTSRQDYVNAGTYPGVHKVKVDATIMLNPGQTIYYRLAIAQVDGGASKYGQGYLEAWGL